MSVKAENVTKLFGKQAALKNVSFEINSGEIVGFIGPNGAGKSTMMKIITGYIPQTDGSVLVNNVNVMENPIEIKRKIGYLPENNPLYTNLYVKEYLQFVANLYKLGKKMNDRVDEMIRITGLEPEKHKKIGALSKGYRQRVGLAQALIHDPSVLILDEPTSGLDPNQIVEIRDLIKKTGKDKTIMLSTHIMQEVEAICERIIIINNGEIVADDKTANIYSHVQQAMTIVVEFNTDIEESQLNEIGGITKIAKLEKRCWLIETPVTLDIRDKVFEFAVAKNLAILSMQKKEKRLEEVFRELTTK
jgi:gliding motility-associated ABC transporter ATP-binding subunit GldA